MLGQVRIVTPGILWAKYGLGKTNSYWFLLLELCTQFDLVICKSFFFNLKGISKVTWIHPRFKHSHILDVIISVWLRGKGIMRIRSMNNMYLFMGCLTELQKIGEMSVSCYWSVRMAICCKGSAWSWPISCVGLAKLTGYGWCCERGTSKSL